MLSNAFVPYALSVFFFFFFSNRVSRAELSQRWGALSAEQKQPYLDAANAERGTYHDRLQKWKDALAVIDEEKLAAPTEPRKRRRTTFGDEHIDGIDDDEDYVVEGDGVSGGSGGASAAGGSSIISGGGRGSGVGGAYSGGGISEGPRGSHFCRPCRQHFQNGKLPDTLTELTLST